ncbi:MAG TPA: efflux RND transporter periplasmic adaptor subunit [Methylococcaceae bacterium]|nr:efflux RND transporter periplasmic adaptor subunit [Methylococcaceae bacterium]
MNRTAIVVGLLAVALGFFAGHWLGSMQGVPEQAEAQPLHYRHPMNPSVTSPIPAKDEMGMDYVPVYAEEKPESKAERKILYYRNPMGLPDTSPVPKQDNMGMDYLPVYADEAQAAGQVTLSPEKIQKLGVRTETAEKRLIAHTVRAVGTVQVDERRVVAVAPRFEGWIDRLYVNATGQPVRKGQTLMDVYSPELLATAEEYRIARAGDAQDPLAEAARKRLRNFSVGEGFLNRPGPVRSVPFASPANGVVLEKNAVEGMRFMAGETLYRIADLSRVWLLADVFEQDLAHIHEGHPATVKVDAWPERVFQGEVAFIYPTVTPETRTAKLRIELPNPDGLLKPAMYGSVELVAHPTHEAVIAVSDSAVIDSGVRQLVLVQKGEGSFEPRPVRLGKRVEGYAEILEGLAEGETVVVQANFLIDAESNLKAALGGFGGGKGGQP